jgi:hypothetical protein
MFILQSQYVLWPFLVFTFSTFEFGQQIFIPFGYWEVRPILYRQSKNETIENYILKKDAYTCGRIYIQYEMDEWSSKSSHSCLLNFINTIRWETYLGRFR